MTTRASRDRHAVRGVRAEQTNLAPSVRGGFQERVALQMPLSVKGISNPVALANAVDEVFNSLVDQMNVILDEKLRLIDRAGRLRADEYTDEAGRPVALHRVTTEEDIPAEDLIQGSEVPDNIGGEGIDVLAAAKVEYVDTSTVESLQPAESGAEATTGKSLTVLADRDAANISYAAGGGTVESLKPAAAGADVTGANQAATIVGQGALATKSSVAAAEIDAGAVGESELATNAVVAAKIAAGAVGTSEIAAGAVEAGELATDAVTGPKIKAGVVGTSKIGAAAVTNAKCGWGGAYTPNGHSDTIGLLNNAVNELQAEVVTLGGTINKPVSGGAPEV